ALAEQLVLSLGAQAKEQNDALLRRMQASLEAQPTPVSEEVVQQVLAAVQTQAQDQNQAVLAEVRAQLQLENHALLEELLASLQSGDGRLAADASGSRLLSHMR